MKRGFAIRCLLILGIIICFGNFESAHAVLLDLTSVGSGTIDYAFYSTTDPKGSGTGNIDTFVQVKSNTGTEHAYNTTVKVLDNGTSAQFNHAMLLSDVPIVSLTVDFDDGKGPVTADYREFLLDANEEGEEEAQYISLDEIQVFVSDTEDQGVDTFLTDGLLNLTDSDLAYRMDASTDNMIKLSAVGSGQADMFAYFPDSEFDSSYENVYLYSQFGLNVTAGDGFEEWAVKAPPIPEPAALSLLGLGLLGLAGFGRKRS